MGEILKLDCPCADCRTFMLGYEWGLEWTPRHPYARCRDGVCPMSEIALIGYELGVRHAKANRSVPKRWLDYSDAEREYLAYDRKEQAEIYLRRAWEGTHVRSNVDTLAVCFAYERAEGAAWGYASGRRHALPNPVLAAVEAAPITNEPPEEREAVLAAMAESDAEIDLAKTKLIGRGPKTRSAIRSFRETAERISGGEDQTRAMACALRDAYGEGWRNSRDAERASTVEAWRLRDVMLENLTSTQAECTRLKNATRLATFLENKPAAMLSLLELAWAMDREWAANPDGPHIQGVLEVIAELLVAHGRCQPLLVRELMLKLATVAMMILVGKPSARELAEYTSDGKVDGGEAA